MGSETDLCTSIVKSGLGFHILISIRDDGIFNILMIIYKYKIISISIFLRIC